MVRFIEKESRMVVTSAWGSWTGELLLMGTEFQVGMLRKVWRWMVVMAVEHCERT